MKNSEVFLSTYNKLDNYLREQDKSPNYVGFSSLVHNLKRSHRMISHFSKELLEYNDLRNAIVHERIDGQVIAEPNDFCVKEFTHIYNNITSPQAVYDVCRNNVKTIRKTDSLSHALEIMSEKDFSQLPVYDKNSFVKMLNYETITSWMVKNMKDESILLSKVKVEDVLNYHSDYRKTVFLPRSSDIYEIIDVYKKNVNEPKQIDAIIITHNGKDTEKPLTIVTDFDISLILKHV